MSRRSTTFSKKAGFEVYLVNAKGTKNLPGRKQCAEESMADEAAHLRSVAKLVSPSRKALILASSGLLSHEYCRPVETF